ncbi:hypothetical protein C0989_002722 [Termitomyces sp. Mn162]|nr:hypothetical protein C0989_002722 [Termitomyces sp. Mn162]
MLLKFTTADILNTVLVDVSTGEQAYDIVTVLEVSETDGEQPSGDRTLETYDASEERRHTTVKDALGTSLVSITWTGRRPDITILNEKVGQLADLFGSSTVKFMPKILVVPTRFDSEYIWTATPDSLTLFDYDSETVKGTFYQNVIRISAPFKSKSKSSTQPTLLQSSSNSPSSPSSPSFTNLLHPSFSKSSLSSSRFSETSALDSQYSPSSSSNHRAIPECSFISTHLPGVGGNYLEFCQHPLAHDVEIIVSFLMMEILRRGRFSLTPYTFEKPRLWQLKEARDLVLRRLRRNTV